VSSTDAVVIAGLPAPRGAGEQAGFEADVVELTADERRHPRRRVTTRSGRVLVLALPFGEALVPGALLHVAAAWYASVAAAPEPVLAVSPRSPGERIAVAHAVGSLHGSVALDGDRLLVPDEPPIERALDRLGAPWVQARLPFVPLSTGTPH